MGQQQSREELIYQLVNYESTEWIKSLHSDGAGLEWMNYEGKTPLIAACMNPKLYDVAKTLLELGANINAYRPGRFAGTPLHHAAEKGLEQTVKLLLSHGANALVMNDGRQTPLDVARIKGYSNVVRAIENHICLFSGFLHQLYGPRVFELFAPQLLSRKLWVVVLPCGSPSLGEPCKLELVIYTSLQDAQPRTIISLWKANMEKPNFSQTDATVIITDDSTKMRIKLAAANESDKQQLQRFCNACKGVPQVVHPAFPFNTEVHAAPATAPTEDMELTMAIDASLQSSMQQRPFHLGLNPGSAAEASTSRTKSECLTAHCGSSIPGQGSPQKGNKIAYEGQKISTSGVVVHHSQLQSDFSACQSTAENSVPSPIPSAPPVADSVVDDGPIHYPSIDDSPTNFSAPHVEMADAILEERKDTGASSSCVICLDARIEGACIPCGHMAGCMSCLNEIKEKKWGCPVCRVKMDQVIRLYAV
ncbi:hypothetical protein ACH5RR_033008 [Cinchona calisaya]|uniref:RING-type domain-containing protein n=1 Tax=Cinchona calisaya TaxID=153742 RepID=A0ABD2YLU3_9GENT